MLELLHKLAAYGISGQLLAWMRVVLGEHKADWKDVLSGVPQGSNLGSLLFVLFINELGKSFTSRCACTPVDYA